MNIKTPEDRLKTKQKIQSAMRYNLMVALHAHKQLTPYNKNKISSIINNIITIKNNIESKARELGYSQSCQDSISLCNGECCKWHFPKNLTHLDLFIAIWDLPAQRLKELVMMLNDAENQKYQCPLLLEDGCFFSFKQRPTVCTIAYPCFTGQFYWEYQEEKLKDIKFFQEMVGKMLFSVIK